MIGLTRRPAYVPLVQVDIAAAQRWERKGFIARQAHLALSPQNAAYDREQHRIWRAAGGPQGMQVAPAKPEFNAFRASSYHKRS